MKDKIKTSIVVDRRIWEAFREKVVSERGAKSISKAVEEALEEELVELLILEALDSLEVPSDVEAPPTVKPVEPRKPVKAEEVIREVREARVESLS